MVDKAQAEIRIKLKSQISEGFGAGPRAPAQLDGSVMVAHQPQIGAGIGQDLPEPTLVAERRGEGFGLPEAIEDSREFSERPERIAKVEPQIDDLLDGGTSFGQVLQSRQCLLKQRDRLPGC